MGLGVCKRTHNTVDAGFIVRYGALTIAFGEFALRLARDLAAWAFRKWHLCSRPSSATRRLRREKFRVLFDDGASEIDGSSVAT